MIGRLLVAALALAAGVVVALAGRGEAPAPQPVAGVLRPDFAFPDLDGGLRHASEWDGRPLLLNFWASWCGPCRDEIPLLIEARHRAGPRDLQVVGIAIDDAASAARFAREAGIDYPVLIGEQGGIGLAVALGNASGGLPFTVAIDRHGRVVAMHQGLLDAAQLATLVAAAAGP